MAVDAGLPQKAATEGVFGGLYLPLECVVADTLSTRFIIQF